MNCKQCDTGQMIRKTGRNGDFMACNNYPNCKSTENVAEGESKKQDIPAIKVFHLTDEECRARALESAIEHGTKELNMSDILIKAKVFEVYIREGFSYAKDK